MGKPTWISRKSELHADSDVIISDSSVIRCDGTIQITELSTVRVIDLGTIAENIFFEYKLEAVDIIDGEIDTIANPISYKLIAGKLPPGIQLSGTSIAGIPIKITGVPADVDIDNTNKFTIRAQTENNEVADITFTVTVSGQKVPIILTPSGQIAEIYYGNYVDIQIDASDEDSNDVLFWEIKDGELPIGLELVQGDRQLYIRGYPYPISALPSSVGLGYGASGYDEDLGIFGFDYSLATIDKNYEFLLSVTDGTSYTSRRFSVLTKSKSSLSADNTIITSDLLTPTVDINQKISPIITNTQFDLGEIAHNNNFSFEITALDFENDEIAFKEFIPTGQSSKLPVGLSIDPVTGWLHGNISPIPNANLLYEFDVVAYKVSFPDIISIPQTFRLTIIGNVNNTVTWNSPDLMIINNGEISELAIDAIAEFDTILEFTLVDGTMPTGLILTIDGLIVGRSTFSNFTLDSGNTTIDAQVAETTFDTGFFGSFDNTYTFTVRITDTTLGIIDFEKEFQIAVRPLNNGPYEALYLAARPSLLQRQYHNNLIENTDVLPTESLYRANDVHFGIQKDLRFLVAEGLTPSTIDQYSAAMAENHYKRKFRYSELKIARSLDKDRNIIYEVIYANIVDQLTANSVSIGPELIVKGVDVLDLATRGAIPQYNTDGSIIIRPASIENMRNNIINSIGQVNKNTLPNWMTSIQEDDRILGFIPAVPIVFCKPGQGSKLLLNLNNSGFDINQISFEVDRYIWDNNLTNDITENVTYETIDEFDQYIIFPLTNVFK